jgi:hypothetical protein
LAEEYLVKLVYECRVGWDNLCFYYYISMSGKAYQKKIK